MNHAPSSSATGAGAARANHATHNSAPAPEATPPTMTQLAARRKKNRQLFNRKRGELLDDLLRNFDTLIYAELSTIYYMDCSFLRFAFRGFVQFVFLTLKQPPFPEQPAHRPVIAPLVGSNLICLLIHVLQSAPEAGEATRGYLHGGLAMDFIGQKGPSSRVVLVVLDLVVLALQLVHMAAGMARKRAREAASSPSSIAVGGDAQPAGAQQQQDVEAEERGEHRAEYGAEIEMQTLNPSGAAAVEASASEPLLATTTPRTDAHIFDAFNSGQIVLADLELWKHVKEQWHMVKDLRANADASQYQTRTIRAELAGSLLRMRMGTDALRQSI